jgi:hypothetical protein
VVATVEVLYRKEEGGEEELYVKWRSKSSKVSVLLSVGESTVEG